jgi:4-carboxymuconolactone decarboxylase
LRLKPLEEPAPNGHQAPRAQLSARPGGAQGPFQVLLRSPGLGVRMEELSSYCIKESALPPRLRELALLEAARAFEAGHSWNAHVGKAQEAGVDAEALARLARGEEPGFAREDEQLLHRFAQQLLHGHCVDDQLYDRAAEYFGEQALVDLVGCLGTFTALAMLLNAFAIALPPDAAPPFPGPVRASSH